VQQREDVVDPPVIVRNPRLARTCTVRSVTKTAISASHAAAAAIAVQANRDARRPLDALPSTSASAAAPTAAARNAVVMSAPTRRPLPLK